MKTPLQNMVGRFALVLVIPAKAGIQQNKNFA
jgi:hypothetical protein